MSDDPWNRNVNAMKELSRKRDIINAISPSFCSAKWLQTTLLLQNGFNHSCHHPSPHKIPIEEIENNPAALHNSKYKKLQREMMLLGKRPPECQYCWNIENLDGDYFSDRHYKTSDYWSWDKVEEISFLDPDEDVYPTYLEVSFSNACNFACAYCSPENSSKWMEDIKLNGSYPVEFGSHNLAEISKLGKMPYKNSETNPYLDAFWKWFPDAMPHLRVFRVTGGEPTMSKDFWKTMDMIVQAGAKNLEIAINTNLGVPDDIIDKLIDKINEIAPHVKSVAVYTSAESVGKHTEYVRDGICYEKWLNNIDRILSSTSSRVNVMTTINMLSLPSFTDFIDDIIDFRVKYNVGFVLNRIPLSVNYLRFPPHLQVSLLDESIRKMYSNNIQEHCLPLLKSDKYNDDAPWARLYLEEHNQLLRFCDYMETVNTAEIYRKDFVKFINDFDRRRGKNFSDTFPEYAHLLIDWK